MTDNAYDEISQIVLPKGVQRDIDKVENSDNWILKYEMYNENKEAARILSGLNSEIMERYNPIILSNGCSAYFNKSLYPKVNEFERKLRKLLYLASSLTEEEEYASKVCDLEEKTFGEIFTILFIDRSFVDNVKTRINGQKGMSGVFTRQEIIEVIQGLEENTLWDNLLGKECASTLRKKFYEIKEYRNDVMHAHNIDVERFNKATKLFTTINGELDSAIGKLIGTHEDNESTSMVAKDFNKILGAALQNMQSSIKLSGIAEAFDAMYSPQMKEKWEILSKAMSEQVTKNLTVSLGQGILR